MYKRAFRGVFGVAIALGILGGVLDIPALAFPAAIIGGLFAALGLMALAAFVVLVLVVAPIAYAITGEEPDERYLGDY
jgi:Na+/serine symporter